MKIKSQIFAIVVAASLITSAFGQSDDDKAGSVGFRFLNLGADARSTGMGRAYTALVDDALAVFSNPGGLGMVENISISFTHSEYLVETKYESFAAAMAVEGIGTFGLGITFLDYGGIKETDFGVAGGFTGNTLDPSDLAIGVSFARMLSDKFSMGVTVKYFQEDLDFDGIKASGVAFDVGTVFDTGYRGIKIGAAMTNFGPDVGFSGDGGFESDQDIPLPQTFRIGVSMDSRSFNENENLVVTGSVDLLKNADTVQRLPVGVEVMVSKMLMLRGGYVFGYSEGSYSFGVGVHVSKFRIDYSLSKLENFGTSDIQRFSIGIEL